MNINEFLRAFLDSAAVYLYVVDRETDDILLVNDYFAKHLGVSKSYIEKRKCWEFVDPDGGKCDFCPRILEAKRDENMRIAQAYNPTLGIWGKYTAYPVTWIDGRQADVITMTDISNEKILRDRLEKLAYYDKITGMPNLARMERDMVERNTNEYCVIAFGKIELHDINVKYGRSTGDDLLTTIAGWTKDLGLQDTEIYRVDGNVFCMVIYNAAMSSARGLAEKMRVRFNETWTVKTDVGIENLSVGISVCVADGRTGFSGADELVSDIELALNKSTADGRIVIYGE